jgi:cyclohexanecarboxylate-CoA ligase
VTDLVGDTTQERNRSGGFAPRLLPPLIDERAATSGSSLMIVDRGGRELSFAGFATAAHERADELRSAGLDGGSRVAWQLPTWTETVVLMAALSLVGVVQIPIPHIYREREVTATLKQVGADVLITPTEWRGWDYAAMARSVRERVPVGLVTLERDAAGGLEPLGWFEANRGAAGSTRTALDADIRWVFLTSGTASAPKGVLHTDHSVIIPSVTMADALHLREGDRSAIAFPVGHVGGINWVVASLLSGCGLLLADRLDDDAISFFDARGVTMAGVSTAFHLAYRDRARAQPGTPLFPAVRAFPGGGATKPPSLHHELIAAIGGKGIVSGYGLTECPMIAMATIDDPSEKLARTEGRPSRGMELRILDLGSGAPVPPGEPGLIWVRGPQLFRGYIDDDNADAFDADGFFCTGDIGYQDADGYVVISGRSKDVVIRKGENISAKEVEDHLYVHPAVADVAVIGLPDEAVGERCCAVIVLAPGQTCPSVADLGRFLAGRGLMPQKWPEQVEVVPALPRNPASKILKGALIEQFTASTHEP